VRLLIRRLGGALGGDHEACRLALGRTFGTQTDHDAPGDQVAALVAAARVKEARVGDVAVDDQVAVPRGGQGGAFGGGEHDGGVRQTVGQELQDLGVVFLRAAKRQMVVRWEAAGRVGGHAGR
jgi:hypothetical protein